MQAAEQGKAKQSNLRLGNLFLYYYIYIEIC